MKNRIVWIAGGMSALGLALMALPGPSATKQGPENSSAAQLEQKFEELQTRLREKFSGQYEQLAEPAQAKALHGMELALAKQERVMKQLQGHPGEVEEELAMVLDGDAGSWLGVETHEVTAEKAKELKLPAERGVLLGKIIPDSPAAKAGLKENDVVTEMNGQHVEGAAQFHRLIHETPAGRTAQLTVWRDGRAQTISVTLGKAEERHHSWMQSSPGAYAFRMPEMPMIPDMPEVLDAPEMGEYNLLIPGGHPRLGIDAEDLSGQFGAYFGAPEGEGVLVREVNPGSPAEKAGVKAGDVLTSLDGQRLRSVGDLREKLAGKKDEKSVKLGLLRNKAEMSLTVELPPQPQKRMHKLMHRTNI
jgi:C-terminal processing protease CtpA/Prc